MRTEARLLTRALGSAGDALAGVTIALAVVRDGVVDVDPPDFRLDRQVLHLIASCVDDGAAATATTDDGEQLAVPMVVAGRCYGAVVARAPQELSDAQRAILRVVTGHAAVAIENARIYQHLEGLFRDYTSPEVAAALLADPEQARLGGAAREVSILFADLRGFTSYSERATPEAVVALLNRYFAAAVPAILGQGGTVSTFIGDAVMALFSAPAVQIEHPLLAARAALDLQSAVAPLVTGDAAPRFRVGVNTGMAVVGNIGTERRRIYTAIGDAVNLASRLEGIAEPGQVVIGEATYERIRPIAFVDDLGPVVVKGRAEPAHAYVLRGLREVPMGAPQKTVVSQ